MPFLFALDFLHIACYTVNDMKNIYKTIQKGVLLGVALFAFAGEVFAAPMPAETFQLTETSVTLSSFVDNANKMVSSVVWFEWSENPSLSPLTTAGMSKVFDRGFFNARIYSLKPGTTYYYRAVVVESGATSYSPIASFTTKGGALAPVTTTISYANNSIGNTAPVPTQTSSVQTQTQTTTQVPIKKKTTSVATVKKAAPAVASATQDDGFTNRSANTAAAIGAGDGILPGTLVGWLALIVAILAAVLLGQMIYESSEKRKKVRLAKKLAEEEKEMEIDKVLAGNR